VLLIEALAAHRLTRLVTADTITEPVRARIIEGAYRRARRHGEVAEQADAYGWDQVAHQDPDVPKLAELITCRWCAGMWVCLGIVFLGRRSRWWPPLANALALSSAAALLAHWED
jgi:hypothetical protein